MKRLSGASLLVFANKTDVQGCMSGDEILQVRNYSANFVVTCLLGEYGS